MRRVAIQKSYEIGPDTVRMVVDPQRMRSVWNEGETRLATWGVYLLRSFYSSPGTVGAVILPSECGKPGEPPHVQVFKMRKPGSPMDSRVIARVAEAIRAAGYEVGEPVINEEPPNHNGTIWHYATWWVIGAHTVLWRGFYEFRAKQLAARLPWLVEKKRAEEAQP